MRPLLEAERLIVGGGGREEGGGDYYSHALIPL